MTLIAAVGATTVVLSSAAKLGALLQLRLNHRHRSAGFSWGREVLAAASYASWLAYGPLIGDPVVTASGALGTTLSAVLLTQAALHRKGAPS
ncbi:hypothetical protein [Actinomadura geliboluensis]|uniref:hypothetical protein n=1 Tax=Actinomadura geliboluensis TaxID=882440 RepID=UPI003697F264